MRYSILFLFLLSLNATANQSTVKSLSDVKSETDNFAVYLSIDKEIAKHDQTKSPKRKKKYDKNMVKT